jgi:uncharacterized protein (TIGR00251 family)
VFTVAADGTVILSVHVQPGAQRPGVVGRHGDAVKLRVAAPPEGGRANRAVCELVAAALGVRPADVAVVSGGSSRRKRLAVRTVPPATVSAWLATLPG